jgi:hypothetical protein
MDASGQAGCVYRRSASARSRWHQGDHAAHYELESARPIRFELSPKVLPNVDGRPQVAGRPLSGDFQ